MARHLPDLYAVMYCSKCDKTHSSWKLEGQWQARLAAGYLTKQHAAVCWNKYTREYSHGWTAQVECHNRVYFTTKEKVKFGKVEETRR